MKKLFLLFCIFSLTISCSTRINTVTVNITCDSDPIDFGKNITFSTTSYPLFAESNVRLRLNDTYHTYNNSYFDKDFLYSAFLGMCGNSYHNGHFTYNNRPANIKESTLTYVQLEQYLTRAVGLRFISKASDYEATFEPTKNITSTIISVPINNNYNSGMSCADNTIYVLSDNLIKVNYQTALNIDKTTIQVGQKVTITSMKDFFDTNTFSKSKVENLLDKGYFIVWLTGDQELFAEEDIENNYPLAHNQNHEKLPLPKKYYIIDEDTSTKTIAFKVPKWAKNGTIHVINEHAFNIFSDEDSADIVGNHTDEYAYYTTNKQLIVKE